MELQEMGVDGQGITEPGGSNDHKIFFMKYPYEVSISTQLIVIREGPVATHFVDLLNLRNHDRVLDTRMVAVKHDCRLGSPDRLI
jgi:hypothetical protein